MPVLHLGVVDLPYVQAAPSSNRRRSTSAPGHQTTGDVAGWLENRYHVMAHFAELRGPDIAAALEASVAGALETVLMGGSPATNLFSSAEGKIEETFRRFVESKEMGALGYPGIPTQASLEGKSQRFKSRRGPVRPSFLDTGLFLQSFRAWVE